MPEAIRRRASTGGRGPRYDLHVLDDLGRELPPEEIGNIAIRLPPAQNALR
jgi:acyl-coenzyme A synthetase/AMP-(fatty) acid ligase